MWPKLLHAENLEEDACSCDTSASNSISFLGSFVEGQRQEHLHYGTFFWDVGAEVV